MAHRRLSDRLAGWSRLPLRQRLGQFFPVQGLSRTRRAAERMNFPPSMPIPPTTVLYSLPSFRGVSAD